MGKRQGKGARQRAKERRKREKRARKEARQAEWAAAAARGENTKRRKNNKGKKKFARNMKHPQAYCGNLGCVRCHPEFSDPFKAKPGTALYPRRWTRKSNEAAAA